MACQIKIEGLSATTPFSQSGNPLAVTLTGRASQDCLNVRVQIRITTATSPILFSATVPASAASSPPSGSLPRLFSATFYPDASLSLACGVTLFAEAACVTDASCADRGTLPVVCKPSPRPNASGSQPPPVTGGWPWPDPPSIFCKATGITFSILLMAGASALAIAVATLNSLAIFAAVALLVSASVTYALWLYWCAPGECVRLRAICWAMKRAFIVAIPLPFAFVSGWSALLAIAFGWVAGATVTRLRALRCTVPSSRWSLAQLFP